MARITIEIDEKGNVNTVACGMSGDGDFIKAASAVFKMIALDCKRQNYCFYKFKAIMFDLLAVAMAELEDIYDKLKNEIGVSDEKHIS